MLAAAAVLPFVFIKKSKVEPSSDAIAAPKTYLLTDAWILKTFAYEFHSSLRRIGHVTRIGEGHYSVRADGLRQFNVTVRDFGPMYEPRLAIERYIKPAAETLAEKVKFERIKTLFQIDGPSIHWTSHIKSKNLGVAIRMVKAHQIKTDEDWIRFDVLGRA